MAGRRESARTIAKNARGSTRRNYAASNGVAARHSYRIMVVPSLSPVAVLPRPFFGDLSVPTRAARHGYPGMG